MRDLRRYGVAFGLAALCGFLGTVALLGPPGDLEPPIERVRVKQVPPVVPKPVLVGER